MRIKNQLTIEVQGCPVRIQQTPHGEYICVTGIEKISKRGSSNFKNYLRNQSNIEFLVLWELHHNPNFNKECVERLKNPTYKPMTHVINVRKWINETNSIGFISQAGRYGGTYAHIDIAIQITAYISAETYFYLSKELQRLKKAEQKLLNITSKIPLDKIIAEANRMRDEENETVDES